MSKTDEQLIADYQRGADEAIEMIFLRYQKPILNFALRYLGNVGDAEDVTADVFMGLVRNKKSYTPQSQAKFSTWLFTVARNSCLSKIRNRKRTISVSSHVNDEEIPSIEIPDKKTPADALHNKELALRIQQALQLLPIPQKEAFVLREFHDLSYEEIGSVTGNSLSNVKILIFRAREELRKNLGNLLGEVQA